MTAEEACDEMLTVFKAAWDATGYPVIWDDLPGSSPGGETPWARVTVRHATGGQASLSGADGAKRWNQGGTLWVQVFSPIGDGITVGRQLAQRVVNAYRDARGGSVWYRNARMREVGNSGAFEQINVLVDFNYDDIR